MSSSINSISAKIQNDLAMIYQHLHEDLTTLKNTRLFVTGGTGFFGKWLLHTFVYCNDFFNCNIHVTVLSRDPGKFLRENAFFNYRADIQFLAGDISDFVSVFEGFDFVIHAATDATQGRAAAQNKKTYQSIVDGAIRMRDFAKSAGVKRLLYTSSGAAYGIAFDKEIKIAENLEAEVTANQPEHTYAAAKRKAENILIANEDFETVVARCFAFCGPFLPLNGPYAFGNFIRDAITGKKIVIQGDGSAVRSYLYAADLVIWLIRILVRGGNKHIYNVGSSTAISMLELAKSIAERVGGCEIDILTAPQNRTNYYVPDVTKALLQLDLCEYTSLRSAIIQSMEFSPLYGA